MPERIGILVLAHAGYTLGPSHPFTPGWVKRYDPEAFDGRGDLEVTQRPEEALVFASHAEAFELWRAVPSARPLRPDGKPNRPLTAYTVTIEPLP